MSGLSQNNGDTAEYLLTLVDDHPDVEAALRKAAGVTAVAKEEKTPQYRVTFHKKQTDPNALLRATLDSGAQILGFQEVLRQLNEAFMDLTEPGVPPMPVAGQEMPPPIAAIPGGPA
jgi:ABC-2 type transport system ATP-binding protein